MTKENKEIEFVIWAQAKLKEYDLHEWDLKVMLVSQLRQFFSNMGSRTNGITFFGWKTIWMNQQFVYDYKLHTSKDLFLHEIAHALLPPSEGHNKKFRELCKSIGCHSIYASNNHDIFDMYRTYDITEKQEIACCTAYMKRRGYM